MSATEDLMSGVLPSVELCDCGSTEAVCDDPAGFAWRCAKCGGQDLRVVLPKASDTGPDLTIDSVRCHWERK